MRYLILLAICPGLVIGQTNTGALQSLRSPNLQLTAQSINLSVDSIKVSYTYNNSGNEHINETLVFALPANGEDSNKQLTVLVNKQPIQFSTMQRAISKSGHDISKELKALGLPFNPIAAIHSIDASSNRDNVIAKLRTLQVIDKHEDIPNWSVKTYYYWQQQFPSRSETIIEQSYKPAINNQNIKLKGLSSLLKIPGQMVKKVWNLAVHWTLEDKAAAATLAEQFEKYAPQIKNYCATPSDYQYLVTSYKQTHTNSSQVNLKELAFAIDQKDLWAHSISSFNLTIESPKNMYPLLCWNGDLTRVNSQTVQFSAENYIPVQDLKVLYVQK